MKNHGLWIASAVLVSGSLLGACGSDPDDGSGTGGSGGATGGAASGGGSQTGGASSKTGGASSGGAASGGSDTGGSDTGGSDTGGMAMGGAMGGEGGAMGGEGGDLGTGGAMCAVDELVPVPHGTCADLPAVSDKNGATDFKIWSPDFDNCGAMPETATCNGREFAKGSSPALMWENAPAGTMSFALVFKDISILSDMVDTTRKFGEHYVMWDIPASVSGLDAALSGGHLSADVIGARQWASRNDYGFFGPCPNPFPADHPAFACSLTEDSYAFVLYALDVATLTDLPGQATEMDADGNPVPIANWVVAMDEYLMASDHVLASTEYRATSSAWSTAFAPASTVKYPCTATTTTGCFVAP